MNNLPNGVTAIDYHGDIILTGANMTAATYNGIMTAMPPEVRQNIIGWLRTGRWH